MRVPSFDRFQRLMQIVAIFVCGAIVGSAIYSALQNDIVDQLIAENIELKDQAEFYKKEINKQAQQQRKENSIHSVVSYIEGKSKTDIDLLTEKELKKRLNNDLAIFIGRSIYEIHKDARFAQPLLSGKIYDHIEGKDYELNIKTILVVDGVLQVWALASEHTPKSG
jgi:hypothetical protein